MCALNIWFRQQRALNCPKSAQILSKKTKYFKQYLDLKFEIPFEASTGFIRRFCTRNGIKLKNCHGESFTANKIKTQKFICKENK